MQINHLSIYSIQQKEKSVEDNKIKKDKTKQKEDMQNIDDNKTGKQKKTEL